MRLKRHLFMMLMSGMACASTTASSHAEDKKNSNADNSSQWVVTLGTSVEYGPNFPGSKHSSYSGMPSIDIRSADEPDEFSAPDDNIDYGLLEFNGVEIGPVLGFRDSRILSDERKLRGVHEVKWDFDLGLFAQYWISENQFRVRGELRHAVLHDSGLVADLGADWFQPINDQIVLSAGPRLSLVNQRYMKTYFSVTPQDAAANGSITPFNAGAGISSVGLAVSAKYDVTPDWSVQVYHRYDRLVGDAADSPIVTRFGSQNQFTFGVTLTKAFTIDF